MDKKYIIGLQKGSYSDFNRLYDLYADCMALLTT